MPCLPCSSSPSTTTTRLTGASARLTTQGGGQSPIPRRSIRAPLNNNQTTKEPTSHPTPQNSTRVACELPASTATGIDHGASPHPLRPAVSSLTNFPVNWVGWDPLFGPAHIVGGWGIPHGRGETARLKLPGGYPTVSNSKTDTQTSGQVGGAAPLPHRPFMHRPWVVQDPPSWRNPPGPERTNSAAAQRLCCLSWVSRKALICCFHLAVPATRWGGPSEPEPRSAAKKYVISGHWKGFGLPGDRSRWREPRDPGGKHKGLAFLGELDFGCSAPTCTGNIHSS